MEQIYKDKIAALGYNHLVCDIFTEWENVKDEILIQDRKGGSGNGTIHVFLGAADSALRKEFSDYYQAVRNGVDTSVGQVPVKHYFIRSNIISMLGYVCEYYYNAGDDATPYVRTVLQALRAYPENDFFLTTSSYFKLSVGSSKLRPYFKQFESHGVFTDLVRQVLLPNSAYKISLYKNDDGEYAAFWLLGFEGLTNFAANPTTEQIHTPATAHLPLQVIYYGAPGTGKSYKINEQTNDGNTIRTTFHPDSDYATFVGAYKPTTIDVPRFDIYNKPLKDGEGKPITESRIIYEFIDQAFLQAYKAAWMIIANNDKDTDGSLKKEFLVIEEINRGNCAQVFGDLFQLLDRNGAGYSDYPIHSDKDLQKHLAKAFDGLTLPNAEALDSMYNKEGIAEKVLKGEILILPCNLYIWATMNTSDQSLFPIDSAFKRRWDWKYIPISEGFDDKTKKPLGWMIEADGKRYSWWSFLQKINSVINDLTKSQDKKLGYFFCKAVDGVISAETFADKVLFYLWNEILKDFDADSEFLKDTDGSQLTFDKFYAATPAGSTEVDERKISQLLDNLGVDKDGSTTTSKDNNPDEETGITDQQG